MNLDNSTLGKLNQKTLNASNLINNYVWGSCAIKPFFDGRVTTTRYIYDNNNRITHAQKGMKSGNEEYKWEEPVPIELYEDYYTQRRRVYLEETPLAKEEELLRTLKLAFDQFCDLAWENPDNVTDFRRAIHECQRIVGLKYAAAHKPNMFRQP